jgi:signal transduction histidine kinase
VIKTPAAVTPRGDLRWLFDQLEAMPLRAPSAWSIIAQHLTPCEALSADATPVKLLGDESNQPTLPQAAGPPEIHLDPALAINSARAIPLEPLELVARLSWWRLQASEERASINRLWLNACAVAHRAKDLAQERLLSSSEIYPMAVLRRLGAWCLAAASPPALTEWLSQVAPDTRREWELHRLGEPIGWLARRLAMRWGLTRFACELNWMLEEDARFDQVFPHEIELMMLLREAETWVNKTPFALFPTTAGAIDVDVRALRAWTAEFQATAERDFFQGAQNRREELLAQSHARLSLQSRQHAAALAPANAFLETFARTPDPTSLTAWAKNAAAALGTVTESKRIEVVWSGAQEQSRASNTINSTRPDAEHQLVHSGRKLAQVRIWNEASDGTPLQLNRDLIAAWSAWAHLVQELEDTRTTLQNVVSATRPVVEHTCHVDQVQLRESLAEFAAGAGHELNNPLAVIMGRAQLLLQRTQDLEAQRSLRVMISQCQRAHRMLRDLMFVSRPVEPRVRICNILDTIRRCLDDLRDDAMARGVTVRPELPDDCTLVETDPEQLRHVVDVLTRNALEASSSPGEVVVRCEHRQSLLVIEVWDQGHGFSREDGRHLLVPFYCGRHAGRGLGLGLPRIAHYVAGVGGSLKWSSKPGIGTVFRVTLPAPGVVQVSAA